MEKALFDRRKLVGFASGNDRKKTSPTPGNGASHYATTERACLRRALLVF